jgi:hypothetical protein
VAVGEAPPDGCQEPREQGRHADQHSGPERGRFGLGDAELAHDEERQERLHESEAREHGERSTTAEVR